ncbi:MAG: oligosaccharide flippase family protein [Cellvibrionales bacterium]|nr:oligosaccharide flippase family protein [Cellvibrionales bacterium]
MNFIRQLRERPFAQHLLTLTSATALAQLIPLLISPLLTRLYSPEDMGLFGLFTSTLSILCILLTLRLELGLVSAQRMTIGIRLYHKVFVQVCILSLVFFACSFVLTFEGLPLESLADSYYWLLPAMAFIAFTTLSQQLYNRQKYRNAMAVAQIIRALLIAAVSIVAGLAGLSSGLLMGYTAGFVLSWWLVYRRSLRWVFNKTLWKTSYAQSIKPFKALPLYQMPHALVNTLHLSLPVYLFTLWESLAFSGHYALAYRVAVAPTVIISSVLYQLLYARFAEYQRQGKPVFAESIKVIKWLILFFGVAYSVLALISPDVFAVVFGAQWETAGWITTCLAPWVCIRAIAGPLAFMPLLANKQRAAFLIECGYFLAAFLAIYLGTLHPNSYAKVIALSLVSAVFVCGQLFWYLVLAYRLTKQPLVQQQVAV